MNVIETRGLTKDFGRGKGILDLDMQVPQGRVHGFLGPNGAGKTTAIRLLLDLLRADRGKARIMGKDTVRHASELRQHLGYVPGELALPGQLRGREYLEQSAGLRGDVDHAWRRELVQRLRVDVRPRIRELSKGNKQKIALIDALQHRPPVLILDEPTDGLDPTLREQVRRLLRAHAQNGGTVFLSSHVVHEIQTMCDDVSIVLSGKLRHQARIDDLVALEGMVVEATVPDPDAARRHLIQAGVQQMQRRGQRIRLRVQGNPLPALAALHHAGASEPRIRQGDLEEMFLRLYTEDGR